MQEPDLLAHVPPLVHAPVFAFVYAVLACALGRCFLRATGLESRSLTRAERGLLAITLGVGLLQLLPIALAVPGLLSPANVRASVLVLVVLLVKEEWRVLKGLRRALSDARHVALPRPLLAWSLLFGALLLLLLPHALALGSFGDDDGYHLSAPARWLRSGTLEYLPTYTHTNAGLGFEMSYVIALAFGEARGAKLLHYCMGVLTLGAIVACARRLGDWVAGLSAVALLLISNPIVQLSQIFTLAFVDFPACLSVITGLFVWLAWRDSNEPKLLYSLALCAGLTASFKFTALSMVGVWLVVVALELKRRGVALGQAFATLLRFGLLAAVPVVPWLTRNLLVTGNPVYPLFSKWIPTRDWTPEHAQIFDRYIKFYSWGVASGASLSEHTRKLLILGAACLVIVATALLYLWIRDTTLRALLSLAAAFTVLCIGLTGLLFRYWLPGMCCFALAGSVAASRAAAARLPRWETFRFWPAIALMFVALAVHLKREDMPGLREHAREAVGIPPREPDAAARVWAFVHTGTPADARILVGAFYTTFGASSFGCFPANRFCYTTDSHLQTYINLQEWNAFLQSVQDAKIEYLLLSDQQFTANRHGFQFVANQNEYPFCRRLARERGELLFRADHLELFRLRGPGA